ncbi:HAD family hydrolase [Actinomyces vulturis]|uniref:HAD family hydrolase n=1 Tax=Actinomyces vulturis TaxID=1857645 RepID=UPI001FDF8A73|nr:HAD-IIB family hydrolase [Actinomyces vulturis]
MAHHHNDRFTAPHPPLTNDQYADVVRALRDTLRRLEFTPPSVGPRTLVALDVDGTLIAMDFTLSKRVKETIARTIATGTQVVIATGRGVSAALPVARECGLTRGWMVCANGAQTLRLDPALPGGYEVIEQLTFDPREVIMALSKVLPDAIVAVESPTGFLVSKPFPPGELIEEQHVVSLEELCAHPVSRVVLRAPGMSVEEFSDKIAAAGVQSVEYAVGWTAWLDVAPQGVTKAGALDALCESLGICRTSTIAVGDGSNDREMLEWAHLSVAMGNATDEVQSHARVVTESVWSDGCPALLDAWRMNALSAHRMNKGTVY